MAGVMVTLRVTVRNRAGLATTRAVTVARPDRPEVPRAGRAGTAGRRVRLGQRLVEAGVLTQAQLQAALEAQRATGERLGEIVLRMGLGSQEAVARVLAQQLGIEFLRLEPQRLAADVLLRVPEPMARRHRVVPYRVDGDTLVLGMVDPLDLVAIDDVARATGLEVRPAVITADDFQRAMAQYPTPGASLDAVLEEITPAERREDEEASPGDDAPIVRLADLILLEAVRQGASDVHFEPQEHHVRVRLRVDGTLRHLMTPPRHVHARLASRIKIMASMNIAERRAPQDGRVDLRIGERDVRLRVSTVPTVHGERVVIRVLDKRNAMVEIGALGLRPDDARRFERMLTRSYGIILFTGPTGSGKTTSLYAVLNRLNRPEVNIVTVEDPVEYELPGISQVQVNPKAGLAFSDALRAFLRQDPDVIMVGEIRDEETARLAIQASLTGHLVLSTMHTEDAPGAVARLADMGIEPFLIASSVVGVVAQRLVRVLCPACRRPYQPSAELLASLGWPAEEAPVVYRPGGCDRCGQQGYRGRIGIFEVMVVDPGLRELIGTRAALTQLRRAARAAGMGTLLEDGLAKVRAGVTSLEEVERVIGLPSAPRPRVAALTPGPLA